jgi:DNA-directed RNA polymerase specialized sigma24 family protein
MASGARQSDGMITDADLIASSLEDPVRFTGVSDRHYEAIARFSSRRVGESLAEELPSETLIRAFAQRRHYDLAYPDAAPWLYGIASNLLGKHAREQDPRRRAYARIVEPFAAGDEVQQAEDRVDAGARGPAVAAALARLRPADRDTLLLFALGDQGVLAAERLPNGKIALVQGAMPRWEIPSCFATLENTNTIIW